MTAYDYLLKYRNLSVKLVDGASLLGIDVHEYRNAQDVFDPRNTDNDKTNDVDNMPADLDAGPGWNTAWAALRAKIAKHGKHVGTNKYRLQFPLPTKDNPTPAVTADEIVNTAELAQAFIGKGSPEIIALALRLALAFKLVDATVAAVQSYCDAYVGLDCNGYVGNYLKLKGSSLVGPSTSANPSGFMPPDRRISKLSDVKADSVLCWKTAGHVAIVDVNLGPVLVPPKYNTEMLRCMVCESTGARRIDGDVHTDGLNYTLYEIHPPGADKVFKVKRGLGGGGLNDVYIGNLL